VTFSDKIAHFFGFSHAVNGTVAPRQLMMGNLPLEYLTVEMSMKAPCVSSNQLYHVVGTQPGDKARIEITELGLVAANSCCLCRGVHTAGGRQSSMNNWGQL
jgi:hypothetical protein